MLHTNPAHNLWAGWYGVLIFVRKTHKYGKKIFPELPHPLCSMCRDKTFLMVQTIKSLQPKTKGLEGEEYGTGTLNIMKEKIHPKYYNNARVKCAHALKQSLVRDFAGLNKNSG